MSGETLPPSPGNRPARAERQADTRDLSSTANGQRTSAEDMRSGASDVRDSGSDVRDGGSDALVRRITDRLGVDPELRLEVARELRTHLADCQAEFRAGGAGEEEARASAEKALGDPGELSEQLWQANRPRLRFRAVARWAARLALLPGAIVTVWILFTSISAFPVLPLDWAADPDPMGTSGPSWPKTGSEGADFILRGDPNARNHVEREKSVADRWPENPVYYGNYVQAVMGEPNAGLYDVLYPDPNHLDRVMPLLDRGERIDPNNAFYNLHKASWLLAAACELSAVEGNSDLAEDSNSGAESPWSWRLRVTDAVLFQRGLEQIRAAVDKPFYANRAVEMFGARCGLLPRPGSLEELFRRAWMAPDRMYVGASAHRQLAKIACTHALRLAEKGDGNAPFWTDLSLRLSDKIGAQAPTAIEVLTAWAMRSLSLSARERSARALGDPAEAGDANAESQALDQSFKAWWHGTRLPPSARKRAGLYWHLVVGLTPAQSDLDFEPLRTAENWVVLKVAVLGLLAAVLLLTLILGAMTLWNRVRRAKDQRPILLFVGWGRLGRVCAFSIVIPLALYGVYAHWQFTGPDAYGLNYAGDRAVVELATLGSAMLLLFLGMSGKAIRARAVEVALDVPPPASPRRRPIVTALCVLALTASLSYVIVWWAGPLRPEMTAPEWGPEWVRSLFGGLQPSVGSVVLAGAVVAVAVFVTLREYCGLLIRRRFAPFRRALCRSLIPVVCSAVILIGAACGALLSWGERLASQRITGNAWVDVSTEMERSGYRALRGKFIEWSEADARRVTQAETRPSQPTR